MLTNFSTKEKVPLLLTKSYSNVFLYIKSTNYIKILPKHFSIILNALKTNDMVGDITLPKWIFKYDLKLNKHIFIHNETQNKFIVEEVGKTINFLEKVVDYDKNIYKPKRREILCGIYKITNNINNKVYIGQSVDIHARWISYKSFLNSDNTEPIILAMREYGIDNFNFEILELCPKESLNYLEKKYIELFNSCVKLDNGRGYNVDLGGGGVKSGRKSKKVKCVDTGQIFNSAKEAGEVFGANGSNIRRSCNHPKITAHGCKWEWFVEKTELDIIDDKLEELKDELPYEFYSLVKKYIIKNNTKTYNSTKNSKLILCKENGKLFPSLSKLSKWLGRSSVSFNGNKTSTFYNRGDKKNYTFLILDKYKINKIDNSQKVIQQYEDFQTLVKELNIIDSIVLEIITENKTLNGYKYTLITQEENNNE